MSWLDQLGSLHQWQKNVSTDENQKDRGQEFFLICGTSKIFSIYSVLIQVVVGYMVPEVCKQLYTMLVLWRNIWNKGTFRSGDIKIPFLVRLEHTCVCHNVNLIVPSLKVPSYHQCL